MPIARLFDELSTDEREDVRSIASGRVFAAGATIFRQGDAADGLHVIERGKVAVSARLPGDETIALGELGPGDLLGEVALLDRAERSATVVAREETATRFVDAGAFEALRRGGRPGALLLMRRIATLACERVRSSIRALEADARAVAPADAPSRAESSVARWSGRLPAIAAHGDLDAEPVAREAIACTALRRAAPFFRTLRADDAQAFLAETTPLRFPRGRVVYREGDATSACYVIARGALQLRVARAGETEKLALLGPGALAGQLELIDGRPRAASCVAREPSIVLRLERDAFERLFGGRGPVAVAFFEAACAGLVALLRTANRRLARLAAEERALGRDGVPDPSSSC